MACWFREHNLPRDGPGASCRLSRRPRCSQADPHKYHKAAAGPPRLLPRVTAIPWQAPLPRESPTVGPGPGCSPLSEEIFLSFNLRILRRHGTGTSISQATAGQPRYLIRVRRIVLTPPLYTLQHNPSNAQTSNVSHELVLTSGL